MICITFRAHQSVLHFSLESEDRQKYLPLETVSSSLCGTNWLAFTLLQTNPV